MTKAQQLSSNRIKTKQESTFGRISNGNFGKKPSNGSFRKGQSIIKAKPKAKASDPISFHNMMN